MIWQWLPAISPLTIAAFAVASLALLAYGSRLLLQKHVPRRAVLQLGALRLAMISLIVLMLFRPVLSVPREVANSGGLIVLVDSSASMQSPSGNGSRWDEVRQKLADSPAIRTAGQTHDLHWFSFDQTATAIQSGDLQKTSPAGESTAIAASLRSAWNYVQLVNAAREIHAAPQRVLLASDGLNSDADDVAAAAKELGIAIDILPIEKSPSADSTAAASIELVQAVRRVLVGSETAFQVTVHPYQSVEQLTLSVMEDDQPVLQRELSTLQSGRDEFVVVKAKPKDAGLKRYTFQLHQGDNKIGEPFAVNVQAVDDRHDVLILEDTWRWEFKYLRRVLEDDPHFNLTAFLSRGGNAFVQFGEPDRRVKLGGFPQSRSELDGFDTIVLGDVQPSTWPRGLTRHLQAAVTSGGKSLVVLAGKHLGEWVENPELAQLLPVEVTRESGQPLSGAVEVTLTPAGRTSSWFTMPAGRDSEATVVANLPTIEHLYPALKKRPAATVLVEAKGHQNAHGPLPVIAEHTVGRGRVLFVGTDTLWRWQNYGPRTDDGVTLYSAFWQHALRALAPTEPTMVTRAVFLRPEKSHCHVGELVRLEVEDSASADEAPAANFESVVVLPDGRRLPVGTRYDRKPMIEFEAALPGRYRVETVARSEGKSSGETFAVVEVASAGKETDGAPVDVAALERWAAATGGRVIDATASDGWITPDSVNRVTSVQRQSYDLWHNYSLMLILCGLLAADWLLRLFRGYV